MIKIAVDRKNIRMDQVKQYGGNVEMTHVDVITGKLVYVIEQVIILVVHIAVIEIFVHIIILQLYFLN